MFSTGSKLFLGATTIAFIATLAFGIFTSGDTYWTSMIGLVSVTTALVFLTAINFFVRDSNVGSMQPDATTASAAPDWIRPAAVPIACAPAAQAETMP